MVDEYGREFAAARSAGWLAAFEKAGRDYEFDPALLMAIASRETNMRNIVGDGGHGYGLMQIDARSFPDFCHSGNWRVGSATIQMGASVLDSKRTQIEHAQGQANHIGGSQYVGKAIAGEALLRASVAAYNCGMWAYYNYSLDHDVDRFTTGHNYARDVFARAAEFRKLMENVK